MNSKLFVFPATVPEQFNEIGRYSDLSPEPLHTPGKYGLHFYYNQE